MDIGFKAACTPLIAQARRPLTVDVDPQSFHETRRATDMRLLALDPGPIYEKVADLINPFSRNNFGFGMWHLFPNIEGFCACGCGQPLPAKGTRTRYATSECSRYCNYIYNILAGKTPTIKYYVDAIAGDAYACMSCSEVTTWETAKKKKHSFGAEITHEIDHIVPVILGGGGCWLSNYQQICVTCHISKSAQDKARRKETIKGILASHNPGLF